MFYHTSIYILSHFENLYMNAMQYFNHVYCTHVYFPPPPVFPQTERTLCNSTLPNIKYAYTKHVYSQRGMEFIASSTVLLAALIHAWVVYWDVIQYGQNFLKCLKFPERMYLPILLCRVGFPKIKKFQAKFPEIRKFPEKSHLWVYYKL